MIIPSYWTQATTELADKDKVLKKLIETTTQTMTLRSRGDAFTTLARSIVGQQISVKAAESVWEKLIAQIERVDPKNIALFDDARFRECGISSKKALYLQDLAHHFNNNLLDSGNWERHDDEALITELMKVKGIGRWTAEMFLIFYLGRPDVLPVDDIGLQRAMSLQYNNGEPLSKLKMRKIAEDWQPWRSVATWYMWRSLDTVPVPT